MAKKKTPPKKKESLQSEQQRALMLANQSRALFNEYARETLSTRSRMLQQLLDPRRDLDKECGYKTEIETSDYSWMFNREGIGARVVSVWPEECWCQDPIIKENQDPEQTEFEMAWNGLEVRYNLFHYMQRVDVLSGVGEFGVMLLGLSDGRALNTPVTMPGADGEPAEGETPGPLNLLYLRVFDKACVEIKATEKDKKSPRYGRPTMYSINFAEAGTHLDTADVHWSRVIHVADNRTSSETIGRPRMQQVWHRLMDLRKLLGGSAEMFYKGAFPGYSFETHPDLGDVEIDVEGMRKEFEEWSNGLNRFMATSGITAKSLAPQVADPENHVMIQIRIIAMIIGVPYRILLGSEQAQLASEQDRQNFNKRVDVRREKYVSPWIIRSVIDRFISLGILPTPIGDETNQLHVDPTGTAASEIGSYPYSVEWPDLEKQQPGEAIQVASAIVNIIARYIQSGANQLLGEKDLLVRILDFTPEEADAILEEAEERIRDLDDPDDFGDNNPDDDEGEDDT